VDLGKIDKPSELSRKIAGSRGLVSLSAISIIDFGVLAWTRRLQRLEPQQSGR
jgi:hypothetical protein